MKSWEKLKATLPSSKWTIPEEATYRAFYLYGYEDGARTWKEAARLMGEELKKYAPNKGELGGK